MRGGTREDFFGRRCSLAGAQHRGRCSRGGLPGAALPAAADPGLVSERGRALLRGQGTRGTAESHYLGLWVVASLLGHPSTSRSFSTALVLMA